jgi:hypothetical protein
LYNRANRNFDAITNATGNTDEYPDDYAHVHSNWSDKYATTANAYSITHASATDTLSPD